MDQILDLCTNTFVRKVLTTIVNDLLTRIVIPLSIVLLGVLDNISWNFKGKFIVDKEGNGMLNYH
jgi:glutathione peroxidase-family protein